MPTQWFVWAQKGKEEQQNFHSFIPACMGIAVLESGSKLLEWSGIESIVVFVRIITVCAGFTGDSVSRSCDASR